MPHALLLTGHRGRGVSEFALRLTAALLCPSPLPDGAPCGGCRSCALHDAGNHPEHLVVAPEAVGPAIEAALAEARAGDRERRSGAVTERWLRHR